MRQIILTTPGNGTQNCLMQGYAESGLNNPQATEDMCLWLKRINTVGRETPEQSTEGQKFSVKEEDREIFLKQLIDKALDELNQLKNDKALSELAKKTI